MTKQDWANGFRWCRDRLGAFIATFWMILILFGISAMLTYAFLKLDYHFSRPLAGGVIPADVTQTVAWGTRLFTLVAGSLAIYFHVNEMYRWRLWATILGGFGAILLMAHAYGVAAKIMEGQYARAAAVETVAAADVSTVTDQIDDIDAAMIRAASDRDTALQVAQDTIDSTKDQVVGLSRDDNETIQKANADKAAALATYDAKVKELEAQKVTLRTSEGAAVGDEAKETSVVETFNPLFTFLARLTTWNFDPAIDPPNGHKYVWGAVFFTFFFGFGELALLFCLTGGFAALKVVSERKRAGVIDGGVSEDVPPGHVNVTIAQDEWDAMQEALKVHGNIKAGAKKGARTRRVGNKIEANDEYFRDKIAGWMVAHNEGIPTVTIAHSSGLTLAQMRTTYGPHMSPEEHDALFFSGAIDTPAEEPEANSEVSIDTPETPSIDNEINDVDGNSEPAIDDPELTIPDEPKEYGLDLWKPPANDDPDEKDAA